MEDQPLPVDASPIALSLGYVVDSDLEKDEKDPREDPAYYPADRGNNDDDESSNDDDDDDDVKKDKEEEEEHLAPTDPSDVSTDDLSLPADASPTALSPGYVVDSDPEKDEKDPKEDPAYYPADRGYNDDDESSNDDEDDDDVEKDEEDKHLALADPSDVSTDDLVAYVHFHDALSFCDSLKFQEAFDKELEAPMEDQSLPTNVSPTALLTNYITDSNPEEDEEDPEEDPETMTNVNQGMSVEEIERVTERKKEKVVENANNKRKWEGNHNGSSSQQNKGHKVPRAHTAWQINKKAYAGSLPLCNQCKFHHNGPYTVKCGNYKKRLDNTSKKNQNQQPPNKRQNTGRVYTARHGEKKHYGRSKPLFSKCYHHHDGPCAPKCHQCNRFGHLARDCKSSMNANTSNIQKGTRASQKATCYECGNQGHYRKICPGQKNQNHENQVKISKARGVVHAFGGGETKHDFNNIEDEIEA
uniref:CCHC-type domain-containing protein n=1 Tax=Tanacetum cinerariifolium TaxID=118510 RepID=A0A6L2MPE1_TANCI|nr:hypothetical protein [Tanacetum cinerariifolium]